MKFFQICPLRIRSRVFLTGLLTITMVHSAAASSTRYDSCTGTVPLDLNATARGFGNGDTDLYEVHAPSSGILSVEAVAPIDAPAEPRLALFGKACQAAHRNGKGFTFIEQRVAGLVIEVRAPGIYRFGVAAQDPRLGLGEYKILTRFVPHEVKSTEDPDPNPEPTGEKSTEDPDPNPEPTGEKSVCRPGVEDDHSDLFLCATPLSPGTVLEGKLANSWRDDSDLFSFVLTAQQTVRIESFGSVPILGAVYDVHGHRLAVGDSDRGEWGFRMVTTLRPGRYFVRVEGAAGAEGDYTIRVAPVSW